MKQKTSAGHNPDSKKAHEPGGKMPSGKTGSAGSNHHHGNLGSWNGSGKGGYPGKG